jgi:DNA-binding MarR family transcriptional regulator
MQIISKIIKVDPYTYHLTFLEVLNVLMIKKLTPKEMEVLAAFMSQDESLIEDDLFNGIVRKKVMEKLGLKPGGLGNHLDQMIKKKFLVKHPITKRITIKPFLKPEENNQGFRIKLEKE